jgi:hypothetical protein
MHLLNAVNTGSHRAPMHLLPAVAVVCFLPAVCCLLLPACWTACCFAAVLQNLCLFGAFLMFLNMPRQVASIKYKAH